MMKLTHTPALGIDKHLQRAQGILYRRVFTKFCGDITEDTYYGYGRCYATPYQDGNGVSFAPYAYTTNGEFVEVLLNDKLNLQSFFVIDENEQATDTHLTAKVGLVFIGKPCAFYEARHRCDMELRRDIYSICADGLSRCMEIKNVVHGIDESLSEFKGSKLDTLRYKLEMDYHVFRINFELTYIP